MPKPELPFIIFETTSVCNLNCRYCYNIWKAPIGEKYKFDSYKKARKTLKRLFSKVQVDQITFTGGEPLLAERFLELVLFARLRKKQVSIITNGNAGSRDDFFMLIKMGVGLFELPIHSYISEEHDFMANVNGSWTNSVEKTKQILDLGGNVVAVIVITKHNYKSIKETIRFIQSIGVNRIMLNRYNIGGAGITQIKELVMSKEEINFAFSEANLAAKEFGVRLTSNVCTPLCLLNPTDFPQIGFTSCSSNILNKPLTLDIEGNMRICNHSPIIIGNIYENKIEEILENDYLKKWTEIVPDFCSNCNIFNKCLGGCRAASEQMGLGLESVDPILTILDEIANNNKTK
ncbi:MAG: radical SAM protein [Bacteroidales bacterium]|nr:radical SAM protein [Bacteroidales bacterium]